MNRFKEMRKAYGYKSQADLANVLHVNQTAVSQWERGATTPSPPLLRKMSEMYDCSIEYLLGYSSVSDGLLGETTPNAPKLGTRQEMPEVSLLALKIRELRLENGITQKDLAARLFVTPQAVSKWEKDLATPNPEALVKMAEIFNCSVDHLCGFDGIDQANKGFYTVDEHGNRHNARTATAPVSNSDTIEKTAARSGSGQDAEFIRLFGSLSPQQQKTALAMLRALKETE